MDLLKGALGGVVGGLIGAAVWALIAYNAHLEIGWIAWGIGALVGFGVCLGSGGKCGAMGGLLAIVIALGSIVGGKYATVQLLFAEHDKAASEFRVTDEEMVNSLVVDAITKAVESGQKVKYKNGKNEETADFPADYPDSIVSSQRAYYQGLTEDQRADMRKSEEDRVRGALNGITSSVKSEAFAASFGAMDALFGLLAGR